MRAATVFESMRNEAQQAKQEAADLHVENVRLKAELAALQWRPITEQDVPKYRDEVGCWNGFEWEVKEVRCTYGYSHYVGRRWTHFRAINAPPADKAGA